MAEMRFDAAPVGKARRDARGFLVVPARPTRCGVFPYKRADGTVIHELRHPDDVFDPESLSTLEGASVTHLHPEGFVSPENAAQLEIGVAGPGRKDGAFVAAELSVRRADAIAKVDRNELVECSCSYSLEIDATPGVYEGKRYDQRQKKIRYNHVALGPKGWGRGGPEVRVMRHDSAAVVLSEEEFGAADEGGGAGETPAASSSAAPTVGPDQAHGARGRQDSGTPEKDTSMKKKIRIDGVEYEVDAQVADAYEAARSRADGLQTQLTTAEAQITTIQSRADSALGSEAALRSQLTAAQTQLTAAQTELAAANDPAKRADAIKTRVTLEREAAKQLGEATRFDSLTDRQVREQAIQKVDNTITTDDLKSRSDDYVSAMFDALVVRGANKVNKGLATTQAAVAAAESTRADSARTAQAGGETKTAKESQQARFDASADKVLNAGKPATQGA
jgi:hypothetical protein